MKFFFIILVIYSSVVSANTEIDHMYLTNFFNEGHVLTITPKRRFKLSKNNDALGAGNHCTLEFNFTTKKSIFLKEITFNLNSYELHTNRDGQYYHYLPIDSHELGLASLYFFIYDKKNATLGDLKKSCDQLNFFVNLENKNEGEEEKEKEKESTLKKIHNFLVWLDERNPK